ncbi:penicillin-binding protein 2 [Ornithinimicrobium pekingense]|uniref:Penicillin-binding protein 2 n=1 Tax=Ornithinimicrobium pekingense TaxID=384677 RepID=A0ABQ2F9H7_9MICO|nr:penicillin-binding protein 2 [Ornithinimicrobium pekingense]GGK66646.1 penicillin-binding protein 2 [Ornithinimicrobium pekingense]
MSPTDLPPSRRRPLVRVPRPQVMPPRVRRRPATGPLWAVLLTVVLLGGLLVGRLGQLQLVRHEEAAVAAAEVATRQVSTPAVRGRVLAADGTPLVANVPSTVVTVEPRVLLESEDEGRSLIASAADALALPVEELWGRTRLCGTADAPPVPLCFSGSPYQPVPLAFGVDPVSALAVLEHPEDFPGIGVRTLPVRSYPAPAGVNAAHVLGHLGRPTQEEVDASEGSVGPQDRVGRAGLEQVYDEQLRGTPGTTTVTVDPRGVVTGRLSSTDPRPGADVRTHLDVEVQAAAEQAVAEAVATARRGGAPARSAAAVVLRPDDGGVVAAASWPTYDPGIWTTGVSQADYERLLDPDGGEPLVNRLVARTFPPASTFKVVSLPAALQTGIDPDARYACPGAVTIAGQEFTNYESESYGLLRLPEILEVSCDTSFYRWAYDHWREQGGVAQESDAADRFLAVARGFGLGRPTGVDLPGETAGTLPSRQWRRDYWEATREETCARAGSGYPEVQDDERRAFLEQLAEENCAGGWQWRPGDAVNFSIGQGDVATTPLQMAVVYAAVANGGRLWQPQLAAALQRQDGTPVEELQPVSLGSVALDERALSTVRAGLEGVNVRGTAAAAFRGWPHAAYPVAGKTGSAEAFGREATSWYASYGPVDDPRYVVVVVVEEGGLGSDAAAPAARAIWDVLREQP